MAALWPYGPTALRPTAYGLLTGTIGLLAYCIWACYAATATELLLAMAAMAAMAMAYMGQARPIMEPGTQVAGSLEAARNSERPMKEIVLSASGF